MNAIQRLRNEHALLLGTASITLLLGLLAVVMRQVTGGDPVLGCDTGRERTIHILLLAFNIGVAIHVGVLGYIMAQDGTSAQIWQKLAKLLLVLPILLFFFERILSSPCLR